MRGLREEGFTVEHASDGDDGCFALQNGSWDLVILDWWLPGQDGLSVLTRFRQSGRSEPVLFLTARGSVADRVRGLNGGADDYLCKPFSLEELLARLRALTRRGAQPRPSVLEVDDLKLDPAARRAWRGQEELPLTSREFSLLEMFMRNPGQVLGRFELLEHVWDASYENRSNVIEVYIGYLRDKLDRPFGRHSLETVRGAGYRLRAGEA